MKEIEKIRPNKTVLGEVSSDKTKLLEKLGKISSVNSKPTYQAKSTEDYFSNYKDISEGEILPKEEIEEIFKETKKEKEIITSMHAEPIKDLINRLRETLIK